MHVQVGLGAARQHDPQAGGTPGDEQLQPRQRLRRLKLVQVVDHEHQRLFKRTKVLQQPFDHRLATKPGRRAERLDGAAESRRERVGHREPEVLRVSFALLDRDPRRVLRDPAVLEPRAHQHRLAAARGSADKNHTVVSGPRQLLEQRLATHETPVARTALAPRGESGPAGAVRYAPVRSDALRSPLRSIASQYLRRAPSAQRSAEMGVRGGPIDWVLRAGRSCAV